MSKKVIDVESLEYAQEVFFSLPLHRRLTDKERHKFRVKMKMALLHPFPTCGREHQTVASLIDIFGKSMFKDLLELFERGELTERTKV